MLATATTTTMVKVKVQTITIQVLSRDLIQTLSVSQRLTKKVYQRRGPGQTHKVVNWQVTK